MNKRPRRKNKLQKMEESVIPGAGNGVRVVDKDLTFALRLLKSKVKESGILLEARERREYEKPSARRRKLKKEAIRRTRRERKLKQ